MGLDISIEDLITIGFATIVSSHSSFTTMGLVNIATATKLWLWNDTDAKLWFNFSGSNPKIIVPERAARIMPIVSGATQVYLKYVTAPTAGNLYCEVRK
jgi:hypothetical protein